MNKLFQTISLVFAVSLTVSAVRVVFTSHDLFVAGALLFIAIGMKKIADTLGREAKVQNS